MSDPFVGEIRMWACAIAPAGWAYCDGSLLPMSQYTALFKLIGTTYGGDGRSTFALPNLQGNTPMFWGQGPGLSAYVVGQIGGQAAVKLSNAEVPSHTHTFQASPLPANLNNPGPTNALGRSAPQFIYKQPAGAAAPLPMGPGMLTNIGGGLPHNNMRPYLTLNFCIALWGIFPPPSDLDEAGGEGGRT